jgi:DNA gyrase subunit A
MFLGTRAGMAIRFEESDARAMGRVAYGVRGISLRDDDEVVAMEWIDPSRGGSILTVVENGYGKRTAIDEYRLQSRGGLGLINITTSGRNGRVVGVSLVQETDEVLIITEQGMILRTEARDIRVIGRATQGVRLMDMTEGDRIVSIARLEDKEPAAAEENGASSPPPPPDDGAPAGDESSRS